MRLKSHALQCAVLAGMVHLLMLPYFATIVVLVAADAEPATREQLQSVVKQTIDGSVTVVWKAEPLLSNAALTTAAKAEDVIATLSVSWSEQNRAAKIQVYRARENRFVLRTITFDPADDPSERIRTVGLSLTSMLPPEVKLKEAPLQKEPPQKEPAPKDPLPKDLATKEPKESVAKETSMSNVLTVAPHLERPHAPPFLSIDVLGVAAPGLDTPNALLGGGLAVRGFLRSKSGSGFGIRVAGMLRAGKVVEADATESSAVLGVSIFGTVQEGRLSASAYAGPMVARTALNREIPNESVSRIQPGIVFGGDGALLLTHPLHLVLGVGGEVLFGSNVVFVRNERKASLPIVRGLLTAGIRLEF
jgi:hypothetical protein